MSGFSALIRSTWRWRRCESSKDAVEGMALWKNTGTGLPANTLKFKTLRRFLRGCGSALPASSSWPKPNSSSSLLLTLAELLHEALREGRDSAKVRVTKGGGGDESPTFTSCGEGVVVVVAPGQGSVGGWGGMGTAATTAGTWAWDALLVLVVSVGRGEGCILQVRSWGVVLTLIDPLLVLVVAFLPVKSTGGLVAHRARPVGDARGKGRAR